MINDNLNIIVISYLQSPCYVDLAVANRRMSTQGENWLLFIFYFYVPETLVRRNPFCMRGQSSLSYRLSRHLISPVLLLLFCTLALGRHLAKTKY